MNSYEMRQEARRERLEAAAAKARRESEAQNKAACDLMDMIPPGQPILVGHHSERGHRAHLRKIDRNFAKSCEASSRAKDLESRAAAVGTGGISSDDPEAVNKLRAELAECEASQERMKAANKAIREYAKAGEAAQVQALVGLGYSEGVAHQVVEPDCCGRIGFPSYALSNNNANIRRIKGRIEALAKNATRESSEQRVGDVTVVRDADDNRLRLIFPGKPSDEVRALLKASGFRWSRYAGAWQRQLNTAAEWAAERVLKQVTP